MKPVDQDTPTNCYAACIASILELSIEELHEFDRLYQEYWAGAKNGRHDFSKRTAFQQELLRLGVCSLSVSARPGLTWFACRPRGYSIANGPGPRGVLHSCVALDGRTVHDPHASRAGLLSIDEYEVLIPSLPPAPLETDE